MTTRADPSTFTREHYEAHRGVASPRLCELVVHSLEVIAQLSHAGLAFRFKGGNSQLILLHEPRRFSIDADIVTTVPREELVAAVESLAARCERFHRCEVRPHKTKPWLPMVSFKLYFSSVFPEEEDPFVMLDAVLEPPPYPGVRVPVRCGSLYAAPDSVEAPTVSGLLADKLLCIGPSTLGIPLGKGKDAHRLKHVFDVATLSRFDYDLERTLDALRACMRQENRIQKSEWSLAQVLEDTRTFCSAPLEFPEPPPLDALEPGYLQEIVRGFPDFRSVLFSESYPWERFLEDCRQVLRLLERIERTQA